MSKIEVAMDEVVDHFSREFRRALKSAFEETFPGKTVDEHEFFRAFKRAVRRSFSNRESLPDSVIK